VTQGPLSSALGLPWRLRYSPLALQQSRHQPSFLGPPWQHRPNPDHGITETKQRIYPRESHCHPAAQQLLPTLPPSPVMNGHFAAVGDGADDANFEHGIQVIDGDKEFTCVAPLPLPLRRPAIIVRRPIDPS
jgi:hypothetical protein